MSCRDDADYSGKHLPAGCITLKSSADFEFLSVLVKRQSNRLVQSHHEVLSGLTGLNSEVARDKWSSALISPSVSA